ncbi:sarcosine oxidase subunit gamma [Ruegeria sp. ANG-R]|uniref:sarcosine oxidase subunit gamma n=1 Tax=Ruegeria sp. ANG-R TaxID=1577903 RepID=UPI00057D9E66|nr:sarcosine oxidase subunit gamma family protein [Ruegeria sp. ANG-R]KIC42177.1 sarcosine oxidase subunit gamma [Ruegeria sp. ANG-R]
MDKLVAKTPCDGLLPLTVGSVTLSEEEAVTIHSISPLKGKQKALSDVLKAAHGMACPSANRATGKAGARAVWFGPAHAMLIGPVPDVALMEHAVVVDQSDAWTVVRLEGAGVEDVLARVVPVDLRSSHFKRGHTARTPLFHMTASITRVGENAFQIMVFRSMAKTLVHDLRRAMEGVAARG